MKLMTYNIFDGAKKTLPQIIEVVKAESPDYLTLNEANTFIKNDNRILKHFAKETGFPYFDIALSGEFDYHVAVFSKYPLKIVRKLKPLARACLITLVDTEFGELSIASLHLTPTSEDQRDAEIDIVINFQKQYSKRILMGDMNSLSRSDEYNKKTTNDFNQSQRKKFTTDGKLRFEVINKILNTGYFDSAVKLDKNKDFTVPTPANKDPAHAHMRLDYIFVSEPLAPHLHSYRVVKNKLTDKASDHYPVIVDLR